MDKRRITELNQEEIAFALGVEITEYKQSVKCPFHGDNTASASVDFKNNLFKCYHCTLDGGQQFIVSLAQLYEMLIGSEPEVTNNNGGVINELSTALVTKQNKNWDKINNVKKEISLARFNEALKAFIIKRGITQETYNNYTQLDIITDKSSQYFGYIGFKHDTIEDAVYYRCFIPELEKAGANKHLFTETAKGLYGVSKLVQKQDIILCESIYNYLTLSQWGYTNVVCGFGANLKPGHIYELNHIVGVTTFVIFDNDYAGFTGANAVLDAAKKLGLSAIKLEMPRHLGNDVNQVLQDKKGDEFLDWLKNVLDQYASNDVNFIKNYFINPKPMRIFKTGLQHLDAILDPGYKPGINIITGTPGTGKTAFGVFLAMNFVVFQKATILYCTYEISKDQIWARMCSYFSQHSWNKIEEDPTIVEPEIREKVAEIASRIRVVTNFDCNDIERAMANFDICFVDYLQTMPAPFINESNKDGNNKKDNLEYNLAKMAKISVANGKHFFPITSLPKYAYNKDEMAGKESGVIEYGSQSYIKLERRGNTDKITIKVFKNTRGETGHILTSVDLAHTRFTSLGNNEVE